MSQNLMDVISQPNSSGKEVKRFDRAEINNNDVKVIDRDWFDVRIIPANEDMNPIVRKNRFYTTTSDKYFDSRLGGNIGINPKAQFSYLADIRAHTFNARDVLKPEKLGRYFGEVFDDNSLILKMTMGVADFASLPDYIFSAIDYRDSYVANKGYLPIGYDFGSFVGSAIMLAAFPLMTIFIWGVKAASSMVFDRGPLQYYRVKPTMHTYWAGVAATFTQITTELGILAPELMPDSSEADKIGVGFKFDEDDMNQIRDMMPDLVTDSNYIDVFAIATRAETLHNKRLLREKELYEKGDVNEYDFLGYVMDENDNIERKSAGSTIISETNYKHSFSKFLEKLTGKGSLFEGPPAKETPMSGNGLIDPNVKYTKDGDGRYPIKNSETKIAYSKKLADAIDAGIKDGGQYANFYVKHISTVTETFSNEIGEISSGGKINSVAKGARDINFSLAGGNIIGETGEKIIEAGKNVIKGTLNSMSFGLGNVIQTLTGNSYVIVPKMWKDSTVSLSSVTFRIELRPTYNDPYSQAKDVYLPYAMIMNTVLPQGTGGNSYTAPFLCSTHCPGIQEYDTAIVSNVSVKRGVSNLSFDKYNRAQGIDIDITITDLAPLTTISTNSTVFDSFKVPLEDNTPLGRYLRVLTGRDLLSSKYMTPKIKKKASTLLMLKDNMFSPVAMGLRMSSPLQMFSGGAVAQSATTLLEEQKFNSSPLLGEEFGY